MRFRFRLPCTLRPVPRLLLVELFSSATQQQRQPNFGIVVFGVACGNHFRSLPHYGSHPASSCSSSSSFSFSCSFSPQSLNRQTLPAKCFRRNVPQSCKYKQRCAAQFFENILSFSSGFSPKELHTLLIEQLGNARQSKGRGWMDGSGIWNFKFNLKCQTQSAHTFHNLTAVREKGIWFWFGNEPGNWVFANAFGLIWNAQLFAALRLYCCVCVCVCGSVCGLTVQWTTAETAVMISGQMTFVHCHRDANPVQFIPLDSWIRFGRIGIDVPLLLTATRHTEFSI